MDEWSSKPKRKPKERAPSFPFYARDFLADEAVACMTPEARGGYIMLLCHAWLRKRHGHLPADDKALAALSGLNGRWKACREAIGRAFRRTATEWIQKRMHRVGHQVSHESRMRSARATVAANTRWGNTIDAASMPQHAIAFAFASASALESKSNTPSNGAAPPERPASPPDGGGVFVLEVQKAQDPDEQSWSELFASWFWPAYPRKIGKPAALRAWKSIRPQNQATIDSISAGLERWREKWADPQFIPHPSTFLNQRRYEDQP